MLADAAEPDRDLVRELGADVVLARGERLADRLRAEVANGVDGLVDAAAIGASVLPAVRDSGQFAVLRDTGQQRALQSAAEQRGITVFHTFVHDYDGNQEALDRLRYQAELGLLTLRVARTMPAEQAAEAHRVLARGGTRGRLVLTF